VDQSKFEKAVDYAISRGYFRQRDTANIDQSTDESGLITLRTSGGTTIAQFQTDGDSFDGVGELSRKQEPKQFQSYKCIKCGSNEFKTGQMRVSGGFWASAFEIENNRFNWIACNKCGYTEFYKSNVPGVQKVFDYLIN